MTGSGPNFWVNTPDILHATLQQGGPPAFRLRAALAAITGPSWGMYSGYELCETTPPSRGQRGVPRLREVPAPARATGRDPDRSRRLITRLNEIRNEHRDAIAQLSTLRLHHMTDDSMLCVSRSTPDKDDVIAARVNLDPQHPHEATTWLDLGALGVPRIARSRFMMSSVARPTRGTDAVNYVRLDPAVQPAHVLHVRPQP